MGWHREEHYQNTSITLCDGDQYDHCSFTRAVFCIVFQPELPQRPGSHENVFDSCVFDDCLLHIILRDAVITGCRFCHTDIHITGTSRVEGNMFCDSKILVTELPPSRRQEMLLFARRIPLLSWVLHKLGLPRLLKGPCVVGNQMDGASLDSYGSAPG